MDGKKKIKDTTLVALTIMIAESRQEEKEMTDAILEYCRSVVAESVHGK